MCRGPGMTIRGWSEGRTGWLTDGRKRGWEIRAGPGRSTGAGGRNGGGWYGGSGGNRARVRAFEPAHVLIINQEAFPQCPPPQT